MSVKLCKFREAMKYSYCIAHKYIVILNWSYFVDSFHKFWFEWQDLCFQFAIHSSSKFSGSNNRFLCFAKPGWDFFVTKTDLMWLQINVIINKWLMKKMKFEKFIFSLNICLWKHWKFIIIWSNVSLVGKYVV